MADKRSFESSLHDIVYSIDMGVGLKIIRVLLYVLLLLLVVALYTATQYRGLVTEESMDLAQLGRNVSLGKGMTTQCVRPLSMWTLNERNGEPQLQNHPDLFHPPAYPMVLASGFKLLDALGVDALSMGGEDIQKEGLPAEKWFILPMNHLFSILTGFFLFLIGKRIFSRELGFLGMTIYYLSDLVWKDSISGINIPMAICFIVASFYFMIVSMLNKRDAKSKARWLVPFILSIVCAAVAFLTRYIAIVAVPGLCLFAWLMSGRLRGGTRYVIVFGLLFALMVAPWLIRNYRISGNPMGLALHTALYDTKDFPEDTLARDLSPELSLGANVDLVKAKWNKTYSEQHNSAVPVIGGGILTALFLTTFFYHFIRPHVNYLRWGVGVSLLLMVIIAGFFSDSSVAMLHAFWPFIILFGLSFFYILIDRLDLGVAFYNQALKVLIVVLTMIPGILRILPPAAERAYPPYYPPLIAKVAESVEPDETVCTDMPWATAWYGNRISMLLPRTIDQYYDVDFMNIGETHSPVRALYLTRITSDKPFSTLYDEDERVWMNFLMQSRPAQFPNWTFYGLAPGELLVLDPARRVSLDEREEQ